jgi:hypothetical protein
MKYTILVFAVVVSVCAVSCKRKCHECHYDSNGSIVEIGEYCGDDLAAIEASGYVVADSTYEVHCEEH